VLGSQLSIQRFERFQATYDLAAQKRELRQRHHDVDGGCVGSDVAIQTSRTMKIKLSRVELPAVEMEQAPVVEEARLPDLVADAPEQAQRRCRIREYFSVGLWVGHVRVVVDPKPVDLRACALVPRKEADRHVDLTACSARLSGKSERAREQTSQ
jgi:hypothetical protein